MPLKASLTSAWPRLITHALVLGAIGAIWSMPHTAAPTAARHTRLDSAASPAEEPVVAMARRARVATTLPVAGATATGLPRRAAHPQASLPNRVPAPAPAPIGAPPPPAPVAAATGSGWGNDISWPQCGGEYPSGPHDIGVVGVTGGRPFTSNPCLASQFAWARASQMPGGAQVYINLEIDGTSSGPHHCSADDHACRAYDYGATTALDAFGRARAAGVNAGFWWLDVEVGNYWSDDHPEWNQATVQGAIDAARSRGFDVGVYSSVNQWAQIVPAGYRPGVPTWLAVVGEARMAPALCSNPHSLTGGPVYMVQYDDNQFDKDHVCAAGAAGFASSAARRTR